MNLWTNADRSHTPTGTEATKVSNAEFELVAMEEGRPKTSIHDTAEVVESKDLAVMSTKINDGEQAGTHDAHADQSFAITSADLWEFITCQCTCKACFYKSCCCGFDTCSWCTGISKWKIMTTVFILLGGFVALCILDDDIGKGVISLGLTLAQFLVSPFGQVVLAVVLIAIFGKGIWSWLKNRVTGETFRKIANTINNLPTPVKVVGGLLAAAALVPFAVPAFLPLLAGAGVAVAGAASIIGAVGTIFYAVRRGNQETNNLIRYYGETLIKDVGRLQQTVEDGFRRIESRLDEMEQRILAAIQRLEEKINRLQDSVDRNHKEILEQFKEQDFLRYKKSVQDHNRQLKVKISSTLDKLSKNLENISGT